MNAYDTPPPADQELETAHRIIQIATGCGVIAVALVAHLVGLL